MQRTFAAKSPYFQTSNFAAKFLIYAQTIGEYEFRRCGDQNTTFQSRFMRIMSAAFSAIMIVGAFCVAADERRYD